MRKSSLLTIIVVCFIALMCGTSANAQASRTWVSGVGDDANPCSRTAPCKTFAGAISKTIAGGYINCLDPGGFGAVTITKSITIDCEDTFAGVLASLTTGIILNGAAIVVTLRNLSIEGLSNGISGINVVQGSALRVENCRISGFAAATSTGIRFAPATVSELYVENTTISESGIGILLAPTGAGGARVAINGSRIVNNAAGLLADGNAGGTGGIRIAIQGSEVVGNTNNGIHARTTSVPVKVTIDRSMASNNGVGIVSEGANSTVTSNLSSITGNQAGVSSITNGVLSTYQTNALNDNTPFGDGAFTNTIAPK